MATGFSLCNTILWEKASAIFNCAATVTESWQINAVNDPLFIVYSFMQDNRFATTI